MNQMSNAAKRTKKTKSTQPISPLTRAVAVATSGKSLNACRTVGSQEWYTPKEYVDALGPFGLDPCSPSPEDRCYTIASTVLTKEEDGLISTWPADLFAWLNPPYGKLTGPFLEKLSQHPAGGIALVFARMDTKWAQEHVLKKASAILFVRGRISFWDSTGKPGAGPAGAPSMLVAYGAEAVRRLERALVVDSKTKKAALNGELVYLRASGQVQCPGSSAANDAVAEVAA